MLAGEGFRLLIIGEGPLRAELERQAAGLPPGAVEFRGLMTAETRRGTCAPRTRYWSRTGATLTKVVTSKLFDFCAVGRPVILAADGEMRRLVDEADSALAVPAEDPAALADALRLLRDDPGLRARLAENGRRFAGLNLRERESEALAETLEATAGR